VERSPARAPCWAALLRDQRPHARSAVVQCGRARGPARDGGGGGRAAALRAASAPARSRGGDGVRGGFRSLSSSASSATAISASARSTSKASTTPKSSIPSTAAEHRWSRSALAPALTQLAAPLIAQRWPPPTAGVHPSRKCRARTVSRQRPAPAGSLARSPLKRSCRSAGTGHARRDRREERWPVVALERPPDREVVVDGSFGGVWHVPRLER
jgi:hypothetical protein